MRLYILALIPVAIGAQAQTPPKIGEFATPEHIRSLYQQCVDARIRYAARPRIGRSPDLSPVEWPPGYDDCPEIFRRAATLDPYLAYDRENIRRTELRERRKRLGLPPEIEK